MTARDDPSKPTAAYLELRKVAIIAMFSDDLLMERLVLKGGNAMDIVLGIGGRASGDLDFSIEDDFNDLEDIKHRVARAIDDRFDSAGFKVFELTFERRPTRPRENMPVEWGGYRIEFKVITKSRYEAFSSDKSRMHVEAESVGPGFKKTLTIEISHHEYTVGKIEADLDDHVIVVYTSTMIAIEKLRAICQQMTEYGMRGAGTPRARDFYDIHRICEIGGVRLDTEECGQLLQHMFDAKLVPVSLLGKVADYRDYHEQNWGEVVAAAREPLQGEGFGFYFEYVLRLITTLKVPRNK